MSLRRPWTTRAIPAVGAFKASNHIPYIAHVMRMIGSNVDLTSSPPRKKHHLVFQVVKNRLIDDVSMVAVTKQPPPTRAELITDTWKSKSSKRSVISATFKKSGTIKWGNDAESNWEYDGKSLKVLGGRKKQWIVEYVWTGYEFKSTKRYRMIEVVTTSPLQTSGRASFTSSIITGLRTVKVAC